MPVNLLIKVLFGLFMFTLLKVLTDQSKRFFCTFNDDERNKKGREKRISVAVGDTKKIFSFPDLTYNFSDDSFRGRVIGVTQVNFYILLTKIL